jgi:DNA-binding transcriptional regulator YhcF (GntR family)
MMALMGEPFDLAVDRASEVPLSTQLIWKLRTLIVTGALPPGTRLPGIREVAESAGVNVNTVRAVFARLEEQNLLSTEHGRGTFVAPGVQRNPTLSEAAQAAIERATAAGLDPRDLAAALYVGTGGPGRTEATKNDPAATPAKPATPPAQRQTERRALYAEIAELERELAPLDPLAKLQPRPSDAAPRILSTPELRMIRDDLLRRIEELRAQREEWRAAEQAAQQESERADRERSPARPPGWRHAGVWTGGAGAQVSWTAP